MLIRDTKRRPETERCRQNISIEKGLAIKRVYQVESVDISSLAFMHASKRAYTEECV